MKKHLLALSAAAVLLAPQTVGAEGFSINEWSAEGFGMAGARMFAENDAANMAYNPASLTKVQGEKAKISVAYISPHGKWDAWGDEAMTQPIGNGHNRVNPAFAPGMYYVKQINDKEWLGMGTYARFGNMCQFERNSIVGSNAFSSRLNGVSLGMNYARKHDNKWSTSVGAEINYVGLQLDRNLLGAAPLHIEGTTWALGWNAAVNYAFDEKNEFGVVYRSKVKHSMEAEYDAQNLIAYEITSERGDSYGVVTLPESVMIGYGHKFNDKTRVELNGTWTRWSRFDRFDIYNSGGRLHNSPSERNWKDGWRYAIGIEHKLSDKYSLLGGIAYDESSIPDYPEKNGADFLVPTGTRTTFTIGTQYHDDRHTLAFAVGYMKVGDLHIGESHGTAYHHADMYDSYTKLFSISYQYNF